ncbi:MAG: translation initiation factor Sui1 [Pseudomonadota bacterium]
MRDSRTVYSTDEGRHCAQCNRPEALCICKQQQKLAVKGDGVVRIGRETKGRKGKGVTVITGLPLAEDPLKQMATKLKQLCGTGGTVKDGVIEIQGDHRDKLLVYITAQGYKAKLAGG